MRWWPIILTFVACEPATEQTEETAAAELPPLAAPTVAVASPTSATAFKSTCTADVELVDSSGTTVADIVMIPFKGGRWGSTTIEPGTQLVATLSWEDCENTDKGTGTFTSSTFSGSEGDLFVLHYDGVDAGFEWMVQREEFEGGAAHVQLAEGATFADVRAFADSLGVDASEDSNDATFVNLTWTDVTGVGAVLANAAANDAVGWSEPTWIEKPAWW